MRKTTRLKKMIEERKKMVIAPGAHDSLSAKIIEKVGFDAFYITGQGLSGALIGKPDIGLLTLSEMATQSKNIALAVDIPAIADGDTGHGGLQNVARTVREFETAGVAAIHLEDQANPKKCTVMGGVELVSCEEMTDRIKAAIDARQDPDFMIIGRTDSRHVYGLDDAIERGNRYVDAGADAIILDGLQTIEEYEKAVQTIQAPVGAYSVANLKLKDERLMDFTSEDFERLGISFLIYSMVSYQAAIFAILRVIRELKEKGSTKDLEDNLVTFETLFDIMDASKYL